MNTENKHLKNVRKLYINIILLLMIMSVYIYPVMSGDNNQFTKNQSDKKQINYRIAIDQYHGFYRVYVANKSGRVVPVSYNGTLNISKGDTITWMNDAMPDARLTVISQQKLWADNSGILKWAYKQFSYTFNKSGIYDVYIKENSKFKQKIIVGPIESNPTNTTKTNMSNPNYKNVTKSNVTKSNDTKSNATKDSSKVTGISKIINKTNSSKIINSNNLTNTSKNSMINGKKESTIYNIFIMLPIIAIISAICIRKFQKKVKSVNKME